MLAACLVRATFALALVAGGADLLPAIAREQTGSPAQPQVFRASVDLVVVDAHVTDRDGRPLSNLGPSDFEVTIDGRRRPVLSAIFTEYGTPGLGSPGGRVPAAPMGDRAVGLTPAVPPSRTFVIAVDTPSFRSLDVRAATLAAERFTRALNPDDRVGLVVLPDGPRVAPTTSHAAIRQALSTVVGRKSPAGQIEMTVEEVIDITAAMSNQSQIASRTTVGQIVAAGGDGLGDASDGATCSGPLTACTEQAMNEAVSVALGLERDVLQSVAGLDALLLELQALDGRKTVLFLSGGMPVSDRSGGRPTIDDEVRRLGERATYANATINAIYFDPSVNEAFAVSSNRRGGLSGRARSIYMRALAQFSEPSGGRLLVTSTGAGEAEIDKLVSESASHYVLGVEPDARDRDGRPHRLRVRVAARNTTVRHRQLVLVPRSAP